ncbi:uncharacterized protein [Aristolochia californica]|uniref:uncharacterized protein n=1 Tax=Aristolochia californica TaxID=171875 RepID=UPI0035DC5646
MALSSAAPLFLTPRPVPRFPLPATPLLVPSRRWDSLIPRARRVSSRNRKSLTSTPTREESLQRSPPSGEGPDTVSSDSVDDGYFLPELPGDKPNFWEGPQWDALGFFVQYMWAFGVVFALIACGVAVATYNEGATDFKDTPVYKESVQSRELLDEPEASDSGVFEGNPTENAPSLD